METLVLDGKSYVKASKAARELGYATDYVGQLCRSGKVQAHLIGRTWYVNQKELSTHRVEKKRMSRVKAREQAHKSIEEHRRKRSDTTNNYRNIAIQYESDDDDLMPITKKLVVKTDARHSENYSSEADEGDEKEVVNKGEKVIMSGDVTVVDVTDGPVDEESFVFELVEEKKKREKKVKTIVPVVVEVVAAPKRKDFAQKLEVEGIDLDDEEGRDININEDIEEDGSPLSFESEKKPSTEQIEGKGYLFRYVAVLLFILIISTMSLALSLKMTYSAEDDHQTIFTFIFSPNSASTLIQSKILN
ncbi:MAG: hypothetical protein K9M10_00640 [Candidatus Pacebacteria bacterium]|nr:hypothetical protein [Candidatus Paceibacterota bacterium]MCF7856970.1 hypothetical protein [Candidatus Paceibacterota bacterium]